MWMMLVSLRWKKCITFWVRLRSLRVCLFRKFLRTLSRDYSSLCEWFTVAKIDVRREMM